MNSTTFQGVAWYRAMTLAERISSLRATQSTLESPVNDVKRAARRLEGWKSQSPFDKNGHFEKRLAMDDISEDKLLILLGEQDKALHRHSSEPPLWLTELEQAFESAQPSAPIPLPEEIRKEAMATSLVIIAPLIRQGLQRLRSGTQTLLKVYDALPFDSHSIEEMLFSHFPVQLLMLLGRTLVLELNVARLEERLVGKTPEERFGSFVERLRDPEVALAILNEYPVLARQLVAAINNWVDSSIEFLTHLCADWDTLKTMFSPREDPGKLVAVDWGAGDTHRGGRTVMIVTFDSGLKLVYKPRSMAVEAHFQDLLAWVNSHGDHPPFRTLKVLDRKTHGWAEFVVAKGCLSCEEIGRFYERQGGYLALLYALEATDFHFENLIAAGENPILIDIESLFHPRVEGVDVAQDIMDADRLVGKTMAHSVLRVGLLPMRIWGNDESEGVDISGVGGAPDQLTPKAVPHWEGIGTDKMHLERKRIKMPGSQNRPSLNGSEVNVLDYAEAIEAGFARVYRLLLAHREELLSQGGPLARFSDDEIRVILRATQTYALLLYESCHPDVLRDGLDRDRLWDRLWIAVESQSYLTKIVQAERADLQSGDIPIFTTHPNSRDLFTSKGDRISDFFDGPSLDHVRRRVSLLDETDLQKQLWFIRASLSTLAINTEPTPLPAHRLSEPKEMKSPHQLVAGARAVGDRLAEMSIGDEDSIQWIGLTLSRHKAWTLAPIGTDLYDGLLGVALFLGYLGAIAGEQRYTDLAQVSLATARQEIERGKSSITIIGGFGGWGGFIYTLAHLGTIWRQPELWEKAGEIIERLPDLIEKDEVFDIISGASGCIGALLSLYQCAPSSLVLDAAIQCGDRLIAGAQTMKYGIGWKNEGMSDSPLTGFSHGAAGAAWALLKLSALTGETRFRKAAIGAMTYERSLFSPEDGNWPDLRDIGEFFPETDSDEKRFMGAWCHGAPGIGMARLDSLEHIQDPEIEMEIRIAIESTRAMGFAGNHSLCHGSLGNLELLHLANQKNGHEGSGDVHRIASQILEDIEHRGWICGVPQGVETPGLMTGIAGIGYELLRLAEPDRVPSILVLEPPRLKL